MFKGVSTYSPVKTAILGALVGLFVVPAAIFAYERIVTPCLMPVDEGPVRSEIVKILHAILPPALACSGSYGGNNEPPPVDTDPVCPGTVGTYPRRDPGIPSGSLCRHACGPDCLGQSCQVLQANQSIVICVNSPLGTKHRNCSYAIVRCGSNDGCMVHDNCYDQAVALYNETADCLHGGTHHCQCDANCVSTYGLSLCNQWRTGENYQAGPNPKTIDYTYPPTAFSVQSGPCP